MATNRATILMRNRNDMDRPYRGKLDTAFLNQENEIRAKLEERLQSFGIKEDKTLADRTLSDQGKQDKLAALATDSLESFGFLGRVVSTLEDDANATRATLFAVKPPTTWSADPMLQYQQGKEIRDQVRPLTQPERESRFIRAAETGGDAMLWSLLNAPDDQPMVSEEVKRRALEERAARLHPQAFHRLGQLTLLAEELGGLRDHIVLWLRGLGGDQKQIHAVLGGPSPLAPQVAKKMVAA